MAAADGNHASPGAVEEREPGWGSGLLPLWKLPVNITCILVGTIWKQEAIAVGLSSKRHWTCHPLNY